MNQHHDISDPERRALLKGGAAGIVGAAVAGSATLAAPAEAQDKGALKDQGVQTGWVSYKVGDATIQAFEARPRGGGKRGAVILIPGIFGVTPYMQEATAQVAQSGMVGLCVEFFSRVGGTPKTNDFAELRQVVGKMPDEQILGDVHGGIQFLKGKDYSNGKFGVTGFCMGGRLTLLMAANYTEVAAASPYYGPVTGQPGRVAAMDLTEKIKVPVQGHYGGTDMNPRPADVTAFFEKLKATNPHGEYFIYEGAGHAFHDFSRPSFNKAASEAAWGRTLAFFKKHLS